MQSFTDAEIRDSIVNDRLDIVTWAIKQRKSYYFMNRTINPYHNARSQQMLDLIIDVFSHFMKEDVEILLIYTSQHRDYIFNSMIAKNMISTRDLTNIMFLINDILFEQMLDVYHGINVDNMCQEQCDELWEKAKDAYIAYFGALWLGITGHYPTIEDVREAYVPLDKILKLSENANGKKRKL